MVQEELENKNYAKVEDASLLRFLVDLRGEDSTTKQLRDDLMTMLIAGHETTAAVLTWALFELTQNPTLLAKVQDGTWAPWGADWNRASRGSANSLSALPWPSR